MICPILVAILFAFIEFDRYLLVIHATEEAARMGGRVAVLADATEDDVKTTVDGILKTFGVTKHKVTVAPSLTDAAQPGDPISVKIEVAYDDVSWLPTPQFLANKVLSVSNTLPKES